MPATTYNTWEVTPDGERFLVNSFQQTSVSILPFTVVVKLHQRCKNQPVEGDARIGH